MMRHLVRIFPEQCEAMGDKAMHRLIRDGIAKAAGYQIVIERHVALFIDLMMGIAPDFDRQPEMVGIRRILEDPDLTPDDKLDLIYSEIKDRESAAKTPVDEAPDGQHHG
jgi:hypothetical protein